MSSVQFKRSDYFGTTQSIPESSMDLLPAELIVSIFYHLSNEDLCRSMRVCRKWKEIILDDKNNLWKKFILYRNIFNDYYKSTFLITGTNCLLQSTFSPNCDRLAILHRDEKIMFPTNTLKVSIFNTDTGQEICRIKSLEDKDQIPRMFFSSDSSKIILSYKDDDKLHQWDTGSGEKLSTLDSVEENVVKSSDLIKYEIKDNTFKISKPAPKGFEKILSVQKITFANFEFRAFKNSSDGSKILIELKAFVMEHYEFRSFLIDFYVKNMTWKENSQNVWNKFTGIFSKSSYGITIVFFYPKIELCFKSH